MLALVLDAPGKPLVPRRRAAPRLGPRQVLLRVLACGVCRTDLHARDGELPRAKRPLVLGHEIVGEVAARGRAARRWKLGERVGVPWLAWACGRCPACAEGRENLCPRARFTGLDLDGGYAELAVADEAFCLRLPPAYSDAEAAPLLCAGLIGYRALKKAGDARRVGLYGFGAAAHLVAQAARAQGREVFAFTRPGDRVAQQLARSLGAAWAGGSDRLPPRPLDAALIFAPIGALVPAALRAVRPGGAVVCAGIHMSDIPSFPYALLWGERRVESVANLTRADGEEFLALAATTKLRVETRLYRLEDAERALSDLRAGRVSGAAVLAPAGPAWAARARAAVAAPSKPASRPASRERGASRPARP